jgi:hypothetical protein
MGFLSGEPHQILGRRRFGFVFFPEHRWIALSVEALLVTRYPYGAADEKLIGAIASFGRRSERAVCCAANLPLIYDMR